jgi:hypothetical protein
MKLTIYRDNNVTLILQAFHSDNTAVNIFGCTILMCFKTDQALPNSAALITKGTTNPYSGITITNAATGIFQCAVVAADTQGFLDTTETFVDALITDASGNPFTVANLTTVEVKANITRK